MTTKKPVAKRKKPSTTSQPRGRRSIAIEKNLKDLRNLAKACDVDCGIDLLVEPGEPNHYIDGEETRYYFNSRPELMQALYAMVAERASNA